MISILLPWFLIPVDDIVSVLYAMAAGLSYRASAKKKRKCVALRKYYAFVIWFTEDTSQRLDAILRSSLYSHFSESLSVIATIRAYREEGRFIEGEP